MGTHKIIKAEVVSINPAVFGVRYTFEDGTDDVVESGTKEQAEWDAYDRIGEELQVGTNPQLRSAVRMEELKEYRRKTGDATAMPVFDRSE